MGNHFPNKMKLWFFAFLLGANGFNTNDRPELVFSKGCIKKNSPTIKAGEVPNGYVCKLVKCKNFLKHKINAKIINGALSPPLECLPDNELGCSTEYGFTYKVAKKYVHFPDRVQPKKITITCGYTGESIKIKCANIKAKVNPKLTFSWASELTIDCPSQSDSVWAEWSAWSDCTNSKCERTQVSRTRQCWGGTNSGSVPCSGSMDGPADQLRFCWPKVCGQCHADLGLFKFDFIGKRPVTNRIPWINAAKSVFDGWVSKGKKIANMMCMDQENPEGPKGKACKCDNKGCYFSDAPMCEGQSGYGMDYHWAPGASNEWTLDQSLESASVNDDFTITYTDPNTDPRFPDRVKWWEPNGPSVCRVLENSLMPGFERPIMKNDDGGHSWDFWNVLECDMDIREYPGFPSISTAAFGSQSYEVLRSNKTKWQKAVNADLDKMIIVGNFNNGKNFDSKQTYGLCRFSTCTKSNGDSCDKSASNKNTQDFAKHGKYHPGILSLLNDKIECSSILGAGRNVQQKNDLNAFDVLVVN